MFRRTKSITAAVIGLSALSSAAATSMWENPSAITISNPPAAPPKVGNASFGIAASTRRGVVPSAARRCAGSEALGVRPEGRPGRGEAVAPAEAEHRHIDGARLREIHDVGAITPDGERRRVEGDGLSAVTVTVARGA